MEKRIGRIGRIRTDFSGVRVLKIREKLKKIRVNPPHPFSHCIPKALSVVLNQNYGHVRFVWNHCVEQFQQRQRPLSVTALRGLHPFLQTVSAASLQQKQRDFAETKKQWFNKKRKKRIRAPRFKKKKEAKRRFFPLK